MFVLVALLLHVLLTQPIIDQLLAALASNAKREGADENPIPLHPSQSVTLQHVYYLFDVSFIF